LGLPPPFPSLSEKCAELGSVPRTRVAEHLRAAKELNLIFATAVGVGDKHFLVKCSTSPCRWRASMPQQREIRAAFDRETIVMYQAYTPRIAEAALEAQRFVEPFSFHRMTWIKPSFLWLMHRSNWGQKSGQECVLAVRIKRSGWEKALSLAVLTSFEPGVYASASEWAREFAGAKVHVQWDPERSLRGAGLPYSSIQVGLSRHIICEYVEEWIVGIEDYTSRVRKMYDLLRSGQADKARRQLPPERLYSLSGEIGHKLLIGG
jgi:hypothetical protein